MNFNDVAYTAARTALINFGDQLDQQLESAAAYYTKEEMLVHLGKDSFMLREPYNKFTVERDNTKVTFVGLCNAYSGMFDSNGHKEERRFADQLSYQFRDYVISWFEVKEEIAAAEWHQKMELVYG